MIGSHMVIDRLANAALYLGLQPGLAAAFHWLRTTDLASLPEGKTMIDGDALFAIVAEYTPKEPSRCIVEAHRDYWDVQYVAQGEERMGWISLAEAIESVPYEAERDVTFFDNTGVSFVRVAAGTFTIFGPQDVHMPGVAPADGLAGPVRKIVVKVRDAH